MPQSRTRQKHHHPHPLPPHHAPVKAKRSAAFVVAVLAGVLGLAVAYFTQGGDVLWLIIGTASGAVIGYFVGRSMDKSFEKS